MLSPLYLQLYAEEAYGTRMIAGVRVHLYALAVACGKPDTLFSLPAGIRRTHDGI